MITTVIISRGARKELLKVPVYIAVKLLEWKEDVETRGLDSVRKIPGYHDEALLGSLFGYRSIRLSKAYRAYYKVEGEKVKFVTVIRVDKHEY